MRRLVRWGALLSTVLGATAGTGDGSYGGTVSSLEIVSVSGSTRIMIAADSSIRVKDAVLSSPERIYFDLSPARLALTPKPYDGVSRGGIVDVRYAQANDTTVRVTIQTDARRAYRLARDPQQIRVELVGASSPFAAWSVGTPGGVFADAPAAETLMPTVDMRTPSAALAPRSLVIAGRSVAFQAQPSVQPSVSMNQADSIPVGELIIAFQRFSGRNIFPTRSVTGMIAPFTFDNLPWDVAFREILSAQGYSAVEEPSTGIIRVDSRANQVQQRQTEALIRTSVSVNYTPVGTLAPTIASLLARDCTQGADASGAAAPGTPGAAGGQRSCVVRGSVVADTNTNTLIIQEIESALPDLIRWVQSLDVRTPQVSIQAKIIFVDRTDLEDIGLTYDLGTQTQFFNRLVQRTDPSTLQPIDTDGDGVPDATGGGTPFESDVNIIDLGGNALSAVANASQQVASPALQLIFSTAMGKFDLTTFLAALQEVRLADQEAKPNITVMDNHEASITVGTETPIRTVTPTQVGGGAVAASNIEFKQTGIILRVTPHVTNNRQIRLTLFAERSNLTTAASDLGFTFDNQNAQTQLLVGDGETAVIGGLTITDVSVSKVGIPILVDLPVIGRLFGETRTQEVKRDLLILVTPRIVDDGDTVRPVVGNQ